MARSSKPQAEEAPKTPRAPGAPRLSITLDMAIRKKVRLAAALADMSEGDWARAILAKAARITVEKHFPGKAS